MRLLSAEGLALWHQAHKHCDHDQSDEASRACLVARKPAWDDLEGSARRDLAAEVYSLWTEFGRRGFAWRDWARGRYFGVDPHREWRELLWRLRDFAVPHEFDEDWDGGVLRLTQATWRWQALEGGLVCADCGSLFRPTAAQIGLAWWHNPVRCAGCEVTR